MWRLKVRSAGLPAVALSSVLLGGYLAFNATHPEDLREWVLAIAFNEDDTTWAPGYSSVAFKRLALGASREQARNALGEPLLIDEGVYAGKRIIYWQYTRSYGKRNFRKRSLLFSESGFLTQKVAEYWID